MARHGEGAEGKATVVPMSYILTSYCRFWLSLPSPFENRPTCDLKAALSWTIVGGHTKHFSVIVGQAHGVEYGATAVDKMYARVGSEQVLKR